MPETPAPQVSIVVPVYNVENYIRRCLDSVRSQTLADWECICVDDGSPDGCGAILDEYAAKDSRFVVIHQENGGAGVARNSGLDVARGEYICFIDPDDWIESDTYELALEAARRTDADIVQWGSVYEKEDGTPIPSKLRKRPEGLFDVRDNYEYYSVVPWGKLFRSGLVQENGLRFPPLYGGDDVPFSLKAYAHAKRAFYINKTLYHYIRREDSVTRALAPDKLLKEAECLKDAFAYVEENCAEWCSNGGGAVIIKQKFRSKLNFLIYISPRNYSLCRSVFSEVNKQALPFFLKERTRAALKILLAVWHFDAIEEMLFWIMGKLRELKGARS